MLFLVFGIVSAGALVMGSAYAVQENRVFQSRHMVVQEGLQVVADLQTWKQKPAMFGGGAGRHGFFNVTFNTLGYPHTLLSNRVYKTENGCFMLQTIGEAQHAELTFSAPSCARSDFVTRVIIAGTQPGDLSWLHIPPSSFKILQ